ncbi:hypothetical protein Naga_100597g4 [Nannochloropsis gaditana]|uniref:Uncharacterized protein n=1 Tax=Nannochloropsis gaditana TaxID=72520 RepID=W7TPA2_9STRA|nr:hypothetical protein Naga_100597g4 [Nannochloropsis gaditana]
MGSDAPAKEQHWKCSPVCGACNTSTCAERGRFRCAKRLERQGRPPARLACRSAVPVLVLAPRQVRCGSRTRKGRK